MDVFISFSIFIIIFFFFFFFFFFFNLYKSKHIRYPCRLPPGPRNLPIIGSIYCFINRHTSYRTLRNLSAIYGPIMFLRLGELPTVIISSAEAVREIMITSKSSHNHAVLTDARPLTTTATTLSYGGKDMIFAPYGEYWRRIRRLCNNELLSPKRISSFAAIREEEVLRLLRSVDADRSIDCEKLDLYANMISIRSFLGDEINIDHSFFISTLTEATELLSGFRLAEFFPSVPFIGAITGHTRRLGRCHKNLDGILTSIMQEHREKHTREEDGGDMMDFLLKIQQDRSFQPPLSNDHVKAVVADLIVAGGHTNAMTIEWALTEMMRNPAVMRKAQKEARDMIIGKEGREMNTTSVSYLQLVIKETLRLHPPVPLLMRSSSAEVCEVLGYEIPANARVIVNSWAIGRDPKYWVEPEEFRPERFEEENAGVDINGAHFEFLPFGTGKRMCPGLHFSMVSMEQSLAHLLCYFDWAAAVAVAVAVAEEEEDILKDMTETHAITSRKKSQLRLRAIPRLPLPST